MGVRIFWLVLFLLGQNCFVTFSSDSTYWHNKDREVRYLPEGSGFAIENGDKRFNRSLYGSHTDFRVEAGDLPEFALFLPHMGGNLKFGLIKNDTSKWLIHASYIKAVYIPGMMQYKIKDEMLGEGGLNIEVIPFADEEGILVKMEYFGSDSLQLVYVYGGASGSRFHRNGDIGADPESVFYLHPKYCYGDTFEVFNQSFDLSYYDVRSKSQKQLHGCIPPGSEVHIGDAAYQDSPLDIVGQPPREAPVLATRLVLKQGNDPVYFSVFKPFLEANPTYDDLPDLFEKAGQKRDQLAKRITLSTPDSLLNTLAGAMVMAADGLWDGQSFMHGAVAWRMPLNGWRGASMADPLGWSDRAQTHFRGYARAQYLEPDSGPNVPDTDKGLARQKEEKGVSLFTKGYISRRPGSINKPHHYDMNLVFIDQVIRHLDWTGDTAFLREIWPVIERHMEWEKRCFDGNNDGLYDAYCCIWASDALQYSGGGVTHSSAYNYFSNMKVARLAEILGEDPGSYKQEAEKILTAMNNQLWLTEEGKFAEYKDLLGNQLTHPSAAAWTYYHSIDSKVPDHFQAYLMARNMALELPKIPIKAKGLEEGLYTVSTTNWMPYTWSINNVALAEVMHTCLAYWQAGRATEAFPLWRSALIESMYLGSCPGNMQQLSFYDAFRGELYRDFADPTAMVVRSLVEGLFGIQPDALDNKLFIKPGLPESWDSATLALPEISIDFRKQANKDVYTINQDFSKTLNLELALAVKGSGIDSVKINDKMVDWVLLEESIDQPRVLITAPYSEKYRVEITWKGPGLIDLSKPITVITGSTWSYKNKEYFIHELIDPQEIIKDFKFRKGKLKITFQQKTGDKTFFMKLAHGNVAWWEPVNVKMVGPLTVQSVGNETNAIRLTNHSPKTQKAGVFINHNNSAFIEGLEIPANSSIKLTIHKDQLISGTNRISIKTNGETVSHDLILWDVENKKDEKYSIIPIRKNMNDKVTQIFKNDYLSPRSPYPTLQLPVNGVGNWCYNTIYPSIEDSGFRAMASAEGRINMPNGVIFETTSNDEANNIVFTSLWDNYPEEVLVEVNDTGKHLYLLMAGSTNPMQSRFVNGLVIVVYEDGSTDSLALENPTNWWPIEQDYYQDGYAFDIGAPKPYRVHLKTGLVVREFDDYVSLKGFSDKVIDGGAATLIDMPVDPTKKIMALKVKTIANDVVIGLMGATLMK